jgi:hypothetical protein
MNAESPKVWTPTEDEWKRLPYTRTILSDIRLLGEGTITYEEYRDRLRRLSGHKLATLAVGRSLEFYVATLTVDEDDLSDLVVNKNTGNVGEGYYGRGARFGGRGAYAAERVARQPQSDR